MIGNQRIILEQVNNIWKGKENHRNKWGRVLIISNCQS